MILYLYIMKQLTQILLFFLLSVELTNAQTPGRLMSPEAYAESLGPLAGMNVATVADTLTRPYVGKKEKVKAIYYWITHQIALDVRAIKSNDEKKSDPVPVMQNRKATPLGFSLLFQEMASTAGIRCLSIDGYTRWQSDQINEKPEEINHSWNVVQLGQSPTEWYYVDAAKGSGQMDNKLTQFFPNYSSGYFFTEKTLFDLDHFPDNQAWLLGNGPKSIQEFVNLPIIHAYAYQLGLFQFLPMKGIIKSKSNILVSFNIQLNSSDSLIQSVALQIGEDKKKNKPEPMNYIFNQGNLSFSFIFKNADEYPVTILVNGKETLTYRLNITE